MATSVPPHAGSLALQHILERTAGAGSWSLNATTGRVTISQKLAEMTGSATRPGEGQMSDVPLADLLALFDVEGSAAISGHIHRCQQTREPFDEEVQLSTPDGGRIWVRVVGEPGPDLPDGPVTVHGLLQDLTEKKHAQNQAMGITMRLSSTLASIKEAFATLDRQGRFTYVTQQSERLLKRTASALLGRTLWDELDAGGSGGLKRQLDDLLLRGADAQLEHYDAARDKWVELRAYPFEEGMAVYFRDVTDSRRSQEQLLLLQTSISHLNDIVMITDASDQNGGRPKIVFVNDAFERLTGYSREEALGHSTQMLHGKLTQRSELARIRAGVLEGKSVRSELIHYKKNGDLFWLELDIVPIDYFNRGLTHWVTVARDITQRRLSEDEIEHLAFYDTLTELPNRKLLMDRLQLALDAADGGGRIGALMFIDLDHFKVLNDTLGHSTGDLLLQKVASRLSGCIRFSDTVARLGGDEFVVMLEGLGDDPAEALERTRVVGQKILSTLSEPYDLAGFHHYSTCSIGITPFGKQREKIGDLLKQADLAMYQAKAAGRNAICFFDPDMQAVATANAELNSELRQAVREQQFLLYYQPQVGREGRMTGVEALLRWQHPTRGQVMPDEFISQAEESALILPIGEWVLRTACLQLAAWARRPETAHLSIAVNVSARQFRHPEFVDLVMRVIDETGIEANHLKLELTESLMATGMDVTIAKMGMLKKAGVTLSIDDFGMGYSALSYLKHLPLDQLKIDRTFVKDILTDPNDAAIARTIIGLAQSLCLNVVAEGVETEAQRAWLEWFGCENYQGYLFCPPLSIDELELFMHGLSAQA